MGSDVNEVLQQAMEFFVAGHTVEAKALLLDLVRAHPTLEAGWMFLSYTIEDPIQKADCLRQVLKINPQNSEAKGALEGLVPAPATAVQPAIPAPVHSSPFTVDISHATDEMSGISAAVPPQGQSLKTVPAFQETATEPEPAPVPTIPSKKLPAHEPPGEAPTPAAPKPVPAAVKTVAKPAEALGTPQPKKRGNLGCTCLGIVLIVLLVVGVVGAVLWTTGTLSSFLGMNPSSASSTPTPGATDTPVILTLPPRWTDTPPPTLTATPTKTPMPTPTPTQTPTPTLASPDATQQAEMIKLEKLVVSLRGLSWNGSPPIYVVSKGQAENVLQSELDWTGDRATVGNQAKAYVALGLIDPTYDLAKYSLTGLSDGLLGFFNLSNRSLYMVGYRFSGLDHLVFTHEFDHALVDHFFPDVESAYNGSICANNTQRCQAIHALAEGDASLLMAQWYNTYASVSDKQDIGLYQIPFFPTPDQNPPAYGSPLSDFIYDTGEKFVLALWQKGRWAQVNKAYDNLPLSTEQILHPEKYIAEEQPVSMAVPNLLPTLGSGWTLVESDSLGEFMTYLMLAYGADTGAQIPQKDALTASAGWGGDHYLVYESSTGGQLLLSAEWSWDTNQDATEFLSSITAYLDKRFQSGKVNPSGRACWSIINQTTCLLRTDKNTLWILAPSMDTVDTVLGSYTAYS